MDDYSALAHRIAGGVADVRGCLILSRDGLILGSFPDDETAVKPAWVKFASLGEPERSFVEFGDQVWVYVRRPAYGAFAVADAGVRPGLLIDQLEQIVLSAEEARSRREPLRVPEMGQAPSGKPRSSLHPAAERAEPAAAAAGGASSTSETRPWARGDATMLRRSTGGLQAVPSSPTETSEDVPRTGDATTPSDGSPVADGLTAQGDDGPSPATPGSSEQEAADAPEQSPEKAGGENEPRAAPNANKDASMDMDADAVVDRVLLAKEFSGLLQVETGDDEGSS